MCTSQRYCHQWCTHQAVRQERKQGCCTVCAPALQEPVDPRAWLRAAWPAQRDVVALETNILEHTALGGEMK